MSSVQDDRCRTSDCIPAMEAGTTRGAEVSVKMNGKRLSRHWRQRNISTEDPIALAILNRAIV